MKGTSKIWNNSFRSSSNYLKQLIQIGSLLQSKHKKVKGVESSKFREFKKYILNKEFKIKRVQKSKEFKIQRVQNPKSSKFIEFKFQRVQRVQKSYTSIFPTQHGCWWTLDRGEAFIRSIWSVAPQSLLGQLTIK